MASVKVLANLVSSGAFCLPDVSSRGGRMNSLGLIYKDTNPVQEGFVPVTYSNPINFQRPHLLIPPN